MDLVRTLHRERIETPALILTAFGSVQGAEEAVREGAFHYLTKPVNIVDLVLWVKRALEDVRLREELSRLRASQASDADLQSHDPAMQRINQQIPKLAQLSGTILVTGESGAGKERIAQALHSLSHRHAHPFVPINCSAIPEALLESELFGHEEGAFTGAAKARQGLFETAGEGTLFLDEIGELPLSLQAKLLRVLQDGSFRRVGSNRQLTLKARIVAATNRDLREEVRQGRFREDLYWRLCVIPIELPPLRNRKADIIPLSVRILETHCQKAGFGSKRLSQKAQELLLAYPWPGNIRELGNAMERAVAFSDAQTLEPEDFSFLLAAQSLSSPAEEWTTLEEVERRYIAKVLEHTGGHRSRACTVLGIDPKTLYRKLQRDPSLEA
jgi:DNA-binding NtrC family response regulator